LFGVWLTAKINTLKGIKKISFEAGLKKFYLEPIKELLGIVKKMNIRLVSVCKFDDYFIGRKIIEANNKLGIVTVNYKGIWDDYLKEQNAVEKEALWVTPVDSHPSEIDHRLIAEAIYRKIKKMNYLPAN